MNKITSLPSNCVFIFGSNSTGFHGAGAAGLACRGTAENTWRDDPWFNQAKNSPQGSPKRIGKWAVYGVPRGFQEGREGKSYAIETIRHPGMKRTTPIPEIEDQIVTLIHFAKAHPELEFLMTPVGAKYAGYTSEEMQNCLNRALQKAGHPENLKIPEGLYVNVDKRDT